MVVWAGFSTSGYTSASPSTSFTLQLNGTTISPTYAGASGDVKGYTKDNTYSLSVEKNDEVYMSYSSNYTPTFGIFVIGYDNNHAILSRMTANGTYTFVRSGKAYIFTSVQQSYNGGSVVYPTIKINNVTATPTYTFRNPQEANGYKHYRVYILDILKDDVLSYQRVGLGYDDCVIIM